MAVPLLGTDPGRCSNQTSLETVHDKLHVTIGGPTGWMSDPTAAGEAPGRAHRVLAAFPM